MIQLFSFEAVNFGWISVVGSRCELRWEVNWELEPGLRVVNLKTPSPPRVRNAPDFMGLTFKENCIRT